MIAPWLGPKGRWFDRAGDRRRGAALGARGRAARSRPAERLSRPRLPSGRGWTGAVQATAPRRAKRERRRPPHHSSAATHATPPARETSVSPVRP